MAMLTPHEIVIQGACYYNIMIDCPKHDRCDKCGWNPENDKARKDRAREKLKEAP